MKRQCFKIVACNVIWRELCHYAAASRNRFQLLFLPWGLHTDPDQLRLEVQQTIDAVPDIHWLWVSMYGPEHFEYYGILRGAYPPALEGVEPGAPELYNIADDPLEEHDLASEREDILSRLNDKLDNWSEDVERDYRSTPEYQEHMADIEAMHNMRGRIG